MRDKLAIFLKYYLPAFLWAGVIFYFSGVSGLRYTENTTVEIILRKGAHFAEYALLVFLLWRVFYSGHKLSIQKSFFWSLALSVFYAASDETHQTFVINRTGQIIDAVFDGVSSITTLSLIAGIAQRKISLKNILTFVFSALVLAGLGLAMIKEGDRAETFSNEFFEKETEILSDNFNSPSDSKTSEKPENENRNSGVAEGKLPSKVAIPVPFTPQAPFANWDAFHEEACEEASIIMLKYHLDGKKLTPELAEKEIQALIAFEIKTLGKYEDTDAQETARLAEEFYGIKNLKVVYDFGKEDIKKYLAEEKPIIIPAAGRRLGNPYFSGDGPPYHMLVLTGYSGNDIITNDPGTKRGERYKYNLDILYNAIHDFPGRIEDIESGRKAMIIVE